MLDYIAGYAARGWRVIQIHSITVDGSCTCFRGPACPPATRGKHPVAEEWQSTGAIPPELLAQVFGPDGRRWNVGILTGEPSGFWVLDVDPDADGPARLAELEAIHGALPETYRVQTGSGGWHHYFRMPADGRPVTNSRGRLARGLDVRGTGGQVVAPPSVSGKGPYRELAVGVPVADAPAWLYELILPRPVELTDRGTMTLPAGAGQVELDGLSPHERERVASYARTAVGSELARVGAARPGERNSTGFAAACNLVELINARWSQLDAQDVVDRWADQLRRTGLDDAEVRQVWASALRKVGASHRAYPPLGDVGYTPPPGMVLPPFPPGPGTSPENYAGPYVAPAPQAAVVTPSPAEPRKSLRERALSLSIALSLPAPEWLVDGWLTLDASSWMIGASGIGKSFVGVSLAASVATGVPWFGNSVKPGKSLYLAAEGARGIAPRFAAWRQEYWSVAEDIPGLTIFPDPIQADGPEWNELCEWAAEDRFTFITIDTQARTTVGMEENSNTDMGRFVDRVEQLRRAAGAAVLVVHHTGKSGPDARGASALKGAAQTEITVTRDETGRIRLAVTKQKDAAEPPPMHLMLRAPRPVPGALVGQIGSSVVLAPYSADGMTTVDVELTGNVSRLAQVAASTFYEGIGGTKSDFRRVFMERGGKSTPFYEAFNRLLSLGIVRPIIGRAGSFRWVPADQRGDDGPLVVLDDGTAVRGVE